jgi:hypothetical protein
VKEVFPSSHTTPGLSSVAMLRSNTTAAAASATFSCTGLPRHGGRKEYPSSFEAQRATNSKSVQAPDANSSSVNDMFRVVAMMFQQIMTAQWGQVRRRQNNGHHKNGIKTHEENGRRVHWG